MISSEVQRTLVKSPPELWAELSDPTTLARHLGALGEIRITRVDPEHSVEWEAGEDTAGKVLIKPSGWGTKVSLTVTRELAVSEQGAAAEVEPIAAAEPTEPEPQPEPTEPEPAVAPPESESRRGFFSRLFGARRRRKIVQDPSEPSEPPEDVAVAEPTIEPPEASAVVELGPEPQGPAQDIAAELEAAEEIAAGEMTAVLTSMLDRLGAAHHRPFSRA